MCMTYWWLQNCHFLHKIEWRSFVRERLNQSHVAWGLKLSRRCRLSGLCGRVDKYQRFRRPYCVPLHTHHESLKSHNSAKFPNVRLRNRNLDRTAKKTPHITITTINGLILFKKIIAVYCITRNTYVQTEELLTVEAGGTYIYHWALKG
jgi:hypothetical protein